ncbi:MAG: hypothetical protein KJ697_02515 [Nanoarchaeota archaeon]|nr:hypothetical protein [Nanoarchaeota archaeon]MBU4124409.1 hypothetical protein [Nanoarchaeota archaeon]
MILIPILGLLDIIAGICLALTLKNSIIGMIGMIILIKGISSLLGSFVTKHFLDWMGYIDVITGICLISGFVIPYFWLLPIFKGTYSILTGF